MQRVQNSPHGVGGWLAFLVAGMLVIGPLLSIGRLHVDFFSIEQAYPAVTQTIEWASFKTAQWTALLVFCAISIYGGLYLARNRTPIAVSRAKLALWFNYPISVIVMGVIIPVMMIPDSGKTAAEAIPVLIASLIAVGLWTAYLNRSKRVKNTYGLTNNSPHEAISEKHATARQQTTGRTTAIAPEGGIKIAPSTGQPQISGAIDEDRIYEEIARELETGTVEKGLWTRLFAECGGDENQTKVLYIKQRAERLISAARMRLAEIAQAQAAEAERLERLRIGKDKENKFLAAVWEGNISKVDQLIREGIKPGHLRDDTGRSAYDLAKERGDQQMIQLLQNHNKLETQRAEQGLMTELGITFDGERYHFQDYRYDKLADAIKYAQTQSTRNGT